MRDLFEHYDEIPPQLKGVVSKWMDIEGGDGLTYSQCEQFLREVNAIGYTFEYGLCAEPFGLCRIDDNLESGTLSSSCTNIHKN